MGTVSAKIVFTIEMTGNSTWNDTSTIKQVIDQAGREAKHKLVGMGRSEGFRVISEPIVKVITSEDAS